MYSCYSLPECHKLFSGFKLSIGWFCLFWSFSDVGKEISSLHAKSETRKLENYPNTCDI